KRDAPMFAARAKRFLAIALGQMGEYDRAVALLREAITEFQRSANPKEEANARISLGILFKARNQTREAREEYQRAIDAYQRIGDRADISVAYSDIAILLWDSGDRDAVEAAVRKVLDISKETGDIVGEGWAIVSLAE